MTDSKISLVGNRAAEYIIAGWVQGVGGYAVNEQGNWCSSLAEHAVAFTANGALYRASCDVNQDGVGPADLVALFGAQARVRELVSAARRSDRRRSPLDVESISLNNWNNQPDQTAELIAKVLRSI